MWKREGAAGEQLLRIQSQRLYVRETLCRGSAGTGVKAFAFNFDRCLSLLMPAPSRLFGRFRFGRFPVQWSGSACQQTFPKAFPLQPVFREVRHEVPSQWNPRALQALDPDLKDQQPLGRGKEIRPLLQVLIIALQFVSSSERRGPLKAAFAGRIRAWHSCRYRSRKAADCALLQRLRFGARCFKYACASCCRSLHADWGRLRIEPWQGTSPARGSRDPPRPAARRLRS